MAAPNFDNLDVYLADFGETIQLGSPGSETEITAIFDNADGQIFDDRNPGGVIVKQPMLTAKSSDVDSLAKGHRVVVAGVEYKVKWIDSSGTGLSAVFLTKA